MNTYKPQNPTGTSNMDPKKFNNYFYTNLKTTIKLHNLPK